MKIIIIGCPGSGKSTLTRKMNRVLNYPVLHLDKIYHIDNERHISSEELIEKIDEFALNNENFIIDGNYISSMEHRTRLADTIIFLDIDTETCLANALGRSKKQRQDDMADGFDVSKIKGEFLDRIKNFKRDVVPVIEEILSRAQGKTIVRLKTYAETDEFLKQIKI